MTNLKENKHQPGYNQGCNNGCNQKQPLHLNLLDEMLQKIRLWVKFIIIFTTDDSCNHQTVLLYTCPLSSITHESLACGLETSISGIKHNFSRLTHESRQIVLQHMVNNKDSVQFPQKYPKKVLKWSWICVLMKSKHTRSVVF